MDCVPTLVPFPKWPVKLFCPTAAGMEGGGGKALVGLGGL